MISISFPLRELRLALYLAFVQWHSKRQVSITAGTKDEKRGRIRNWENSGSELTVLVSRAPIYSEVGWSEQTGALPGWRHHLVSA